MKYFKQIKYLVLYLVLAGVLAAGGFLLFYISMQPINKKEIVSKTVNPESTILPAVKQAGISYTDEKNTDGSITRSFSLENKQYYDVEQKQYQPIDTVVVKAKGDYQYENTRNVFQTYFKDKPASDGFVKYAIAGKSASFSFINANDSTPSTKDNTIIYPGVYDNMDAKYTITSGQLLEEIILNKQTNIERISQKLSVDGVYYKIESDGSITFHDVETKNLVFTIPAPIMYEQGDPSQTNNGLHYEITSEDGKFIISKIIDQKGKDWLDKAEYPLVIDSTFESFSGSADSSIEGSVGYSDWHWTGWSQLMRNDYHTGWIGGYNYHLGKEKICYNTCGYSSCGCYPSQPRWRYRVFMSFNTSSLSGYVVRSANLIPQFQQAVNLTSSDTFNIYSDQDLWNQAPTSNMSLFYGYPESSMILEPGSFSGLDGCTGSCNSTASIQASSISTTGHTQFVIISDNVGTPPGGNACEVDYPNCAQGSTQRWININLSNTLLQVRLEVSAPDLVLTQPQSDTIEVRVQDWSDNENRFILERRRGTGAWDMVCEMETGVNPAVNDCPSYPGITYDCSATSVAGTSQYCVIEDSGLTCGNSYTYRAYAVRDIPYTRSPDSTEAGMFITVFPPSVFNLGTRSGTTLPMTFTDGSNNEDNWLLQTSSTGLDGSWQTFCQINSPTGSPTDIPETDCGPGNSATYNCTQISKESIGGTCTVTRTGLVGNTDQYFHIRANGCGTVSAWRNSNPAFVHVPYFSVTIPPTAVSTRWDRIKVFDSMPTANNDPNTKYCLGATFTNWNSVSPPSDTFYSTDKAININMSGGASYMDDVFLVPPDATSPQDRIDSSIFDMHHAACFTPTNWGTRINSTTSVFVTGSPDGPPLYPDHAFLLYSYYQDSSNYVYAPDPGGILTRYTRARNPRMPNATSMNAYQINLQVDPRNSDGIFTYDPTSCPRNSFGNCCGDANHDEVTEGIDVVFLVSYLKGIQDPPESLWRADTNGDGVINGLDVYTLVRFFKGEIGSLSCSAADSVSPYQNPAWTDYAIQETKSGKFVVWNGTEWRLAADSSIGWYDFDGYCSAPATDVVCHSNADCTLATRPCNHNTENWAGNADPVHGNGGTGITLDGLSPNQCYSFKSESRNQDSISNAEAGHCTLLGSKTCNSDDDCLSGEGTCSLSPWSPTTTDICTGANQPLITRVACNYSDSHDYYCDIDVNVASNPDGTSYELQYANKLNPVEGDWKNVDSQHQTFQRNGNFTYSHYPLTCDSTHGIYLYRVRAYNNSDPPVATPWDHQIPFPPTSYDTLPPCQIQNFVHTDNPLSRPLRIAWKWDRPYAQNDIAYYDFIDADNNVCIAGPSTLDVVCRNRPPENQIDRNLTGYNQIHNVIAGRAAELSYNTKYQTYIRAIELNDNRHRAGKPTDSDINQLGNQAAAAYTAIQAPTGIVLTPETQPGDPEKTSITLEATGQLDNWGSPPRGPQCPNCPITGIQFRETIELSNSGGGQQRGFYNAPPGAQWETSRRSILDTDLLINTQYCYTVKSRNAEGDKVGSGDEQSYPGNPCIYTHPKVPKMPILSLNASTQTVLKIRKTDDNPYGTETGPGRGDTKYAVCITKYNADGSSASKYLFNDNYDGASDGSTSVNWGTCGNPAHTTEATCLSSEVWGYCQDHVYQNNKAACIAAHDASWWLPSPSCRDSDSTGHWSTAGNATGVGWGGGNGIVITGLDGALKHDFKAKAKSDDDLYFTSFGPEATLFLIKNNIVGWAWSSTAGWISMNCLNQYQSGGNYSCSRAEYWGLNTKYDGTRDINPIEGYAWSASGQGLVEAWTGAENVSNSPAIKSLFSEKAKSFGSIAVDSKGYPHIAWLEWDGESGHDSTINYLWWNGEAWADYHGYSDSRRNPVLPASEGFKGYEGSSTVSLALDSMDHPHFAFDYDYLYYKWWDGANWQSSTVGTAAVKVGGLMPLLKLDNDARPHLVWQSPHDGKADLMYAEWDGTSADWKRVDGTVPSSPGLNCSSDTKPDNLLAPGYCLDGPNSEAETIPAMSLDRNGHPYLAWGDDLSNDTISFAYWNGSSWNMIGSSWEVSSLFSPSNHFFPTLAVDSQDNAHLAWQNGNNGKIIYLKGSPTSNNWHDADGELCAAVGNCVDGFFGGANAQSPSIGVDSSNRPHIAWTSTEGLGNGEGEIYYRWWNPQADNDRGAWVTVSGDWSKPESFSDDNLKVSNNSLHLDSLAPSLALDGKGFPHLAWLDDAVAPNTGKYEVDYNGWTESAQKAGLGWISLFAKVCSNNSQVGCSVDSDCGGTNTCGPVESAGTPPDNTLYGFCYNSDSTPHRYGVCAATSSRAGQACSSADTTFCDSEQLCIYNTCQTGGDACPASNPASPPYSCHAYTTANFNAISKEINGWGRILSLKDAGGLFDWGWIKLNGNYNNGAGVSGPYKVTGVEVDSQQFLGDPDVNSAGVRLFSIFGWGWGSEVSDYTPSSVWLNPVNVTVGGNVQESHKTSPESLAVDSAGNPHLAWSNYDSASGSYDIYYLKLVAGKWLTASNIEYVPGVTDSIASQLNVSQNVLASSPANSQFPSLALDSNNIPHIAWQEGGDNFENGDIHYTYWDGVRWVTSAAVINVEAGDARTPSLKVDSRGVANIAYNKANDINFKKLVSNNWVSVTNNSNNINVSNTAGASYYPSLALGSDDSPRIAWAEAPDPYGTGPMNINYRWWDRTYNSNAGAWVSAADTLNTEVSANADLIDNNSFVHAGQPSLALDSLDRPGIVWKGYVAGDQNNRIRYRHWNGDWVAADNSSNSGDPTLVVNSSINAWGTPNLAIINNIPRVAWDDQVWNVGGGEVQVHFRQWNNSAWVDIQGNNSSYADPPLRVSNSNTPSYDSAMAFDKFGNAHIVWLEIKTSSSACTSDVQCINITGYPKCVSSLCTAYNINYTKWIPGNIQAGIGWVEFMPINALLGIPWVKTAYSDIYAQQNVALAPPPRGSGQYNSTYLILANGDITGVANTYGTSNTEKPTSGFVQSGFSPLISGSCNFSNYHTETECTAGGGTWTASAAGTPLGLAPLSKIDTAGLSTMVSDCHTGHNLTGTLCDGTFCTCSSITSISGRNKYGTIVEKYIVSPGGNIGDGTVLGSAITLNNKIYFLTPQDVNNKNFTLDSTLTFQKGVTVPAPGISTSGDGLIIIDGNIEINSDIYYEKKCGGKDIGESCNYDYQCLNSASGTSCQSVPLTKVSELPSAAFIVTGDININSFVDQLAGVFVARDNRTTTTTTEGTISTGRKNGITKPIITGATDDTYVNSTALVNNLAVNPLKIGKEGDNTTDRAFLRWKFGSTNVNEINIPPGSEIKRAYLKFNGTAGSIPGDGFLGRIYLMGDPWANTLPFNDGSFVPTSNLFNALTSVSVSFPITSSWSTAGEKVSPDIATLIQRFIDTPDYINRYYSDTRVHTEINLGLELREGDAATNEVIQLTSGDDADLTKRPQLIIEYSPRQRSYPITNTNNDALALSNSSDVNADPSFGWNATVPAHAERAYLNFVGINIPTNAEIVSARIRATTNSISSPVGLQVRQALLDGYRSNFTGDSNGDMWKLPLDQNVSEVAQDILATDWATLDGNILMPDIAELIASYISRDDYKPGVANSSELAIRIRRGSDLVEPTAVAGARRSIQTSTSPSKTSLDVTYRVPLQVSGLFLATGYNFDREYTKNLAAAEQIVYDGRVVANTPPGLTDFVKALPVYQKVTP